MSDDRSKPQGRIAGIDFGTVRIGVAITDAGQRMASPWDNYQRRGEEADSQYFCSLVATEDIKLFVVGLPVHLSGDESEKSREARQFADWLHKVTGVRIVLFDERFTTREADHLLATGQLSRRQRTGRRDKLAAQVMLTAYLESDRCENDPLGLDEN